jgi:DNA-binding transcriptional ArsR family regulator
MSALPPEHVVARALGHPLRARILRALDGRRASPNQLSGELGAPLPILSYHVRELARAGLIAQTDTRPVRGAVEHYYRATVRVRVVTERLSD